MLVRNILETIGETPLVELGKLKKELGLKANIYAKVEFFNPGGSIKDRVAAMLLEDAFQRGILKKGEDATIIEPTSGNTGVGLALACAVMGIKAIFVMPDTMSIERIKLLKAYGASVVLTEGKLGMQGSVAEANRLNKEIKNSYIPGQFDNQANPKIHYLTTGKEILKDLDNNVDCLVACIGTGGTITGISKAIKEKKDDCFIVGVEPFESPLLSKGVAGPHGIQGIGANFIPSILDKSLIDEMVTVKTEDAYENTRELAKKEGILCGISSGAALCAAIEMAKRDEFKDKNIVVILPDTGERYLSTKLF